MGTAGGSVFYRLIVQSVVSRHVCGHQPLVYDRLYRDLEHPMALGQRVELEGMTATVTSLTADDRPAEAEFRFTVPLEDQSLRWLQWLEGSYVPFTPPPVGRTVNLSATVPSLF